MANDFDNHESDHIGPGVWCSAYYQSSGMLELHLVESPARLLQPNIS